MSAVFLVFYLNVFCHTIPAATACEPVLLDDFSLEQLHRLFETKMIRLNIDLESLDQALDGDEIREVDQALVSLIIDWIDLSSKYDHWITANVESKEDEKISKSALTWLGPLKAIGKRVNALNWLLVANKYAQLKIKLTEIRHDFGVLFTLMEKATQEQVPEESGGETKPPVSE